LVDAPDSAEGFEAVRITDAPAASRTASQRRATRLLFAEPDF
jgi:hypothetical protein